LNHIRLDAEPRGDIFNGLRSDRTGRRELRRAGSEVRGGTSKDVKWLAVTTADHLSAACFDTVLEDQAAIATLIERQLNGAALALMRAAAEGFIRGIWFARCATDPEVERFQKDQLNKGIRKLVNEVEAALGSNSDVLSRMVATQWDTRPYTTMDAIREISRKAYFYRTSHMDVGEHRWTPVLLSHGRGHWFDPSTTHHSETSAEQGSSRRLGGV